MPAQPRFVAADRSHRFRLAVGSRLLVGLPGISVGAVAGHLSPRILARVEQTWGRAVVRHLRLRLEVLGEENVDPAGRYLVLPLHESLVDPAVLLATMPLPLRFVVLDELMEWPWVGRYFSGGRHIPVTAASPPSVLRRLLRWAQAAAERGDSVVVFPQGSVLGIETGFHGGAFTLARRLGMRVLPVVISGTHRVWEHPFSPMVRYEQRATVRFLDPRPPSVRLADLQDEMKALALDPASAPPRRFEPERDGWWDGYPYRIDPRFPELAEARRKRAGTTAGKHWVGSPTLPGGEIDPGR